MMGERKIIGVVREPSTWAGIGLLLGAVRYIVPPQWQLFVDALMGMAGTVSVGLREPGGRQVPQGAGPVAAGE